jgi:hypothetical protein
MRTILSLGALLALSLASCSTSATSLSEPVIETGRVQEPTAPCEPPLYRPWSGIWFSSRVMSSTTGCPPVSP